MFAVYFETYEEFGSFESREEAEAYVADCVASCDWMTEESFEIVEFDAE